MNIPSQKRFKNDPTYNTESNGNKILGKRQHDELDKNILNNKMIIYNNDIDNYYATNRKLDTKIEEECWGCINNIYNQEAHYDGCLSIKNINTKEESCN